MFEIVRSAFAVFLVMTLVFLTFQIWTGSLGFLLNPHDPKYAGLASVNREIFALDQPPWTRYGVWLGDVVTGNLGISFYFREPVSQVVLTALPVTLELLLGSALWAILLGGLLGWGSASGRHPKVASSVRESATVLYALPVAVMVLLLVIWVGTGLGSGFVLAISQPYRLQTPRVTGFPVLDALLSGDLAYAGLVFAATALLTLPAGIAFAMPIGHRVRKTLEARRPRGAEPVPSERPRRISTLLALVPAVLGSLGVLMPFLLGAVMVTEMMSGRRGIGFLFLNGLIDLDGVLLQGVAVIAGLLALALALPFSLLAAGIAHRGAGGLRPPDVATVARVPREVLSFRGVVRGLKAGTPVLPVGLVLLAILVGVALLGPVLAPYGPTQRVVPSGQTCVPQVDCPSSPPSPSYPLGVDFYGEDVFSRVLWGGEFLLAALGIALGVGAGLGLAAGLLPSAAGREADLVLRVLLGGLAALPIFVLALLLTSLAGTTAALVPLAVGFLFVPVVFRDVRDLAAEALDPVAVHGRSAQRPGRIVERVEVGAAAAVPGFIARLPRRAAEMALLLETLTTLGLVSLGPADWGAEIEEALRFALPPAADLWVLYVPAILLILLIVSLLLTSDGLRQALDAPSPPPAPTPQRSGSADANP